jgi:hypothetical protein
MFGKYNKNAQKKTQETLFWLKFYKYLVSDYFSLQEFIGNGHYHAVFVCLCVRPSNFWTN